MKTRKSTARRLKAEAASWVVRSKRILDPTEEEAFQDWLGRDPRHRAAFEEANEHGWDAFAPLAALRPLAPGAPDPDFFAPRRSRMRFVPIAAAAGVILAFCLWWSHRPSRSLSHGSAVEERVLADGSIVDLNRGAAIVVQFTPNERRVRLERGEAQFKVAKDRVHPFIVSAGGVEVRAVGTAFDVRFDPKSVEVLVTEGKVQVASPEQVAGGVSFGPQSSIVAAGERVVVPTSSAAVRAEPMPMRVTPVAPAEIDAHLAWQTRLLIFSDAPLPQIVAEFNRRNGSRIAIADPALEALRLTVTFRSNNVDGFVRLLEAQFGVKAERAADSQILLRAAP